MIQELEQREKDKRKEFEDKKNYFQTQLNDMQVNVLISADTFLLNSL